MDNEEPKILIVDDEKGLRIGTKRLLESEGFNVETAENGSEGILKGTNDDFDIAIIDLKMPDIEGLEVLSEIKKVRPNTICIIATAFASYDTATEATKLGAYSYIPKPFSPEELLFQLDKAYKQRLLILESQQLKREREEKLLELTHEKSRLSTIIDVINNGVLVINKEGKLVYYNSAALRLFNLHDVEIGRGILEKLPPKAKEIVVKILSTEEKKTFSSQIAVNSGSDLIVEAFFRRVVMEEGGEFRGVVIAIRNITDFVKVEKVKSQFVSMVAHELKTPVSAVLGFLKIILDESINITEEKSNEFLDRSVSRLNGLLALVNDLLDISRMELGTKQREIIEIDLNDLITKSLEFLEFKLEEKGIEVEKNIEEELPHIKADYDEINRLFTNLLSNAIKYNKENGKILIDINKSKNYIIAQIKDTGIGMKQQEQEKLFQEFYRAKNSNTRGISGTGLGLSIVKQIAEAYHGKIEVESEYGKGSNFKVFLPINK